MRLFLTIPNWVKEPESLRPGGWASAGHGKMLKKLRCRNLWYHCMPQRKSSRTNSRQVSVFHYNLPKISWVWLVNSLQWKSILLGNSAASVIIPTLNYWHDSIWMSNSLLLKWIKGLRTSRKRLHCTLAFTGHMAWRMPVLLLRTYWFQQMQSCWIILPKYLYSASCCFFVFIYTDFAWRQNRFHPWILLLLWSLSELISCDSIVFPHFDFHIQGLEDLSFVLSGSHRWKNTTVPLSAF